MTEGKEKLAHTQKLQAHFNLFEFPWALIGEDILLFVLNCSYKMEEEENYHYHYLW